MNEGFDELPAELKRVLGEVYAAPRVGAEIDRRIAKRANARLAFLQRWRPVYRIGSIAAAAAIILLTVGLLIHRHSPTQRVASREDLNADGRVDVRDALYLAQRIDHPRREWDFNHDGRVD